MSGNVGGDLFGGFGAGPVKASFGLEARRDTADVSHDLADQGPSMTTYFLSYGLDYAGMISVVEGYGEVNVPVLKDLPLAKYLEFDAAIRETENENENLTTGAATDGQERTHDIDSWKLSSIWDLTDWFRLRGTRSLDVRAAGFRELYESYAVTAGGPFGSIINPVNNQTQIVTALTGGNINLEPEKADTTTVGFVISPKSGPLERFQFSADWYRIDLHDPITGPPFGLGVQNIVNLCYAGNQAFCDRITFGTPGDFSTITTINNTAVNLGDYETRGVDFETSYPLPLPELNSHLNGNLNFRLLTSLLYNMTIDAGLGVRAGRLCRSVRSDGGLRRLQYLTALAVEFLRDLCQRALHGDGAGQLDRAGHLRDRYRYRRRRRSHRVTRATQPPIRTASTTIRSPLPPT